MARTDDCRAIARQHAGVWVLVDPVGSRASAGLAEQFLAQSLAAPPLPVPSSADRLRFALEFANARVFEPAASPQAALTHAISALLAIATQQRVVLAHLGHAACYRLRAGNLTLLTRPHTAVAELGASAADASFATHNRDLLTRGLGLTRSPAPDVAETVLRPGDLLLLVNGGLSERIRSREVFDLFVHGATAHAIACAVIHAAARAGAEGTVVVLQARDADRTDGPRQDD